MMGIVDICGTLVKEMVKGARMFVHLDHLHAALVPVLPCIVPGRHPVIIPQRLIGSSPQQRAHHPLLTPASRPPDEQRGSETEADVLCAVLYMPVAEASYFRLVIHGHSGNLSVVEDSIMQHIGRLPQCRPAVIVPDVGVGSRCKKRARHAQVPHERRLHERWHARFPPPPHQGGLPFDNTMHIRSGLQPYARGKQAQQKTEA
jgi:hypothetical protein